MPRRGKGATTLSCLKHKTTVCDKSSEISVMSVSEARHVESAPPVVRSFAVDTEAAATVLGVFSCSVSLE
jgi:hypothetical protein